jgi:hypothetical protein
VIPISETRLKYQERFFTPFLSNRLLPRRAGGNAVPVSKCTPHNHVDLPPSISVEATGVCLPIGSSEKLVAAVYKSPGRARIDAVITELLSSKRKIIFADDLSVRQPFWNNTVPRPSGKKQLVLFDMNEFEISVPQCPIHYSPAGNGEMVMFWILWSIRISGYQMSLLPIAWTQTIYQ